MAVKYYTFADYATQAYILVGAVLIILFHNGTVPHWGWLVSIHALAMGAIHGLTQWHARARPAKALDFIRHFYPVPLYIWFFSETGWLNRMFFSDYLDPVIIRWEQAVFGCQPSVLFMEKLPYLAVSELFYVAYFSYYIMIAGIGVALFLRNRQQFFHFVAIVSFLFYVCYTIYIIVPIIGPRVFFHEIGGYILPEAYQQLASTEVYPDAVKSGPAFQVMALIYRIFEAPGAAFPSSHVAVAVCTVCFSFRYLRPIRYAHLVLAFLLCLSTVYCRYHYVLDVLAGLLTAALVIPLGNKLYFRFQGHQPSS